MNPLRHLLLALVLVCAQFAAGAHAIEHAVGEGKGLPVHACEVCLAAHDLGSALPSHIALPPAPTLESAPSGGPVTGRAGLPPPLPAQRGPPAA